MPDTVTQIKERLSIVDVVSLYVKLTHAGKSFKGLCPFHKEKTASFHVSPERGTYHCFGCGEGGDIFSFYQKIESVDFKDALKFLAEKAGVKVHYEQGSDGQHSRTDRLRAALEHAMLWYTNRFADSSAEVYARMRGLTASTVVAWKLGYAPNAWRLLLDVLVNDGFTIPELASAGLIKEADGKSGTYYDRFRDRLLFPICDSAGRIVAFTGRIIPDTARGEIELAKYLNSPETELFRKSEILFGMDKAKDAIRLRNFTLLVEGQMDVLHAHQAGFANAVALSGTTLSVKHIALMKRYSENLMLVLDADLAGRSASARSALLALGEGMRVKAVLLPTGKDPADLISADPWDFSVRIKTARSIVEFFLGVLAEEERDNNRLIRAAETIILPLIAAMKSPMEREHFVQVTANALNLSNEAIYESLIHHPITAPISPKQFEPAIIVVHPRTRREIQEEQLYAILHVYPNSALAQRVVAQYSRITGTHQSSDIVASESVLFQIGQWFGEDPKEDAADELLHSFEKAVTREAYQESVQDLRRAESANDVAGVRRAEAVCVKLSARLVALDD